MEEGGEWVSRMGEEAEKVGTFGVERVCKVHTSRYSVIASQTRAFITVIHYSGDYERRLNCHIDDHPTH